MKVVELSTEFVIEKRKIKSEVVFGGNFPGNGIGGYTGIGESGVEIFAFDIAPIVAESFIGAERSEIREPYGHGVVADLTKGVPDLEHIHPAKPLFDELFFGYIPCSGDGWKEVELMAFSEIFRSVIAEIEVEEVARLVAIRKPTCEPLISAFYALHDILAIIGGVNAFFLCILYYSTEGMIFELFVIVQFTLQGFKTVASGTGALGEELLCNCSFKYKFTVGVAQPFGHPTFWPLHPADIIVVVDVVTEASNKT